MDANHKVMETETYTTRQVICEDGKEFEGIFVDGPRLVDFLVEWTLLTEGSARFTVYRVDSWDADDGTPDDYDKYLVGLVMWDGRTDIYFGEHGSLSFHGKRHIDRHNKLLSAIWDMSTSRIEYFNQDAAK